MQNGAQPLVFRQHWVLLAVRCADKVLNCVERFRFLLAIR